MKNIADAAMCPGAARLKPQRFLETSNRLVVATAAAQRGAEIKMIVWIVFLVANGLPQPVDRGVEFTRLGSDAAEHVEEVRIFWIELQGAAPDVFRVGETSRFEHLHADLDGFDGGRVLHAKVHKVIVVWSALLKAPAVSRRRLATLVWRNRFAGC